MFLNKISLFIAFNLFVTIAIAQENTAKTPEFLQYTQSTWVDSIMESLTPQERIGQLIWVAAYSNRGPEHRTEILNTIKKWNVGGLVFFKYFSNKSVLN